MPSVTTAICTDFSATPGTGVNWTNIPITGCLLSPDGKQPWPFNVGPPLQLPSPSTIEIKVGLKPGTYCARCSCCEKPICITVS
jgi:hypothetical protein